MKTTIVLYESPKRLFALLELMSEEFGDIECFLARDISKLREKYFSGKISEAKELLLKDDLEKNPHGEWVCIFNHSV